MEICAGLMPNLWGVVRGNVIHLDESLLNKKKKIELLLTLLHEASMLAYPERTCDENERFARRSLKVIFHLHRVRETFKTAQQLAAGQAFHVYTLDFFSDACYFLNELLKDDQELCRQYMLELNIITQIGSDWASKQKYREYIDKVEERFNRYVWAVWNWYEANKDKSPWYLAAGVYARIVGSPQLFEEGNHRTGMLIASYILMREGYPPFVISEDNVEE